MDEKYIDLHVHTLASDGHLSVEDTLKRALNNNVGVLSLTEHYNLGSYKKARMLAKNEIEIIPGIEIGASLKDLDYSKNHVCHILAYYPSYNICAILDEYEKSREICVKKTINKLKKYIPITYTQVKKYARNKNSIGRFDIALAMYKLGFCKDPMSAYGEYLDTGKACFVDREKLVARSLIEKIRKVNGVPVLAHPKSLKLNNNDMLSLISKLKSYGLEGIEVYNPHHSCNQISFFEDIANEFDLVATVGSDFHGKASDGVEIALGIDNNLMISNYDIITKLKQRQNKIINNF